MLESLYAAIAYFQGKALFYGYLEVVQSTLRSENSQKSKVMLLY